MKSKFLLIPVVALGLLFGGCTPSPEEARSINTTSLSSDGDTIGTLPTGQAVHRYIVWDVDGRHTHSIYVVSGAATISDNYRVPAGKSSYQN